MPYGNIYSAYTCHLRVNDKIIKEMSLPNTVHYNKGKVMQKLHRTPWNGRRMPSHLYEGLRSWKRSVNRESRKKRTIFP